MKVFLSWSGDRSRCVAEALHAWLPSVLQFVTPWLSSSDIRAGARWANELEFQIRESNFGILCLTPDNLSAPWMLYEAGALSRALKSAYVTPYLFGFPPSELRGPLMQFQAVMATREGTLALVHTLNKAVGKESLDEKIVEKSFEKWWPDLESSFGEISDIPEAKEDGPKEIVKDWTGLKKVIGKTPPTELAELLQAVLLQLASPEGNQEESASAPKERVFIVHGHDHSLKEAVARFVERLGPVVIILHEQPNKGKTIIEKFESYADVDYAIVLMTGDDMISPSHDTETENSKLRARQNVIFELGFFAAKLGRSRISVLYQHGVEIPSDFSGIVYINIDDHGAWRFKLAQELKTAGLNIDLNNAI